MPEKIIEIPGIGNVSFPDSMSDSDISAVVRKQYAAANKPAVDPNAAIKRQQQLNYPSSQEQGEGGVAQGVGGITEGIKRGLSNVAGIIPGVLGLRDPDSLIGQIVHPKTAQDRVAELNTAMETNKASQAKQAAEAKLPGLVNPNTARTLTNIAGSVVPGGSPAPLINRAIEGDPVGALTESATTVAVPAGIAKGLSLVAPKIAEIRTGAKTTKALNAATVLAEPGTHGAPQPVAKALQGRFAATVGELKGPGNIPVKEGVRGEVMGDLYHGATAEQRANMASVLDKPIDQVNPLALEAANKVVSDIHAPMRKIFEDYAKVEIPKTAKSIANQIRADAASLTPPSRDIWYQWANEVESNPTVGGINHVKENANLAYAKLADKTLPSAQAEGTVTQAQAAKSTAEFIRKELYPELEKVAPGITEQGRLEAKAWDFRDGVYKTWTEAAKAEAPAALRSWHEKMGIDALRGVLHPGKTTLYTAIKPTMFKTPLKKFNELLNKASGDVGTPAGNPMLTFGGTLEPQNQGYDFLQGKSNRPIGSRETLTDEYLSAPQGPRPSATYPPTELMLRRPK